MSVYTFRPAKRSEAKPLIGIYSESGAGKTFSALVLARGYAGPEGKIGMIETEGGRGEAYADATEYPEIGGYLVTSIRGNFAPKEYSDAIKAAEKEGLDALIIDSASHEWEGDGGVLAQAAENEAGGKKGLLVWQKPKISHQRDFMLRFMQTPIPLVILCMRAKYPMIVKKRPDGSNEPPVRSEVLEPKQSDDILSEMFMCGWIDLDHRFHVRKSTSRTLETVFPDGKAITVETGRQLAVWAEGRKPKPTGTRAVVLKAADGFSVAGEYPTITEWLNAFAAAVRDAPTADVAQGLWEANSEYFYSVQVKADKAGIQDVLKLCNAVTSLIDEKTARPEQEDTHGGREENQAS